MLDFTKPVIMGILNVTPDSFSDGGDYFDHNRALDHAHQMIDEGADIIDIGGESTRPGSAPVNSSQEIERVLPIIEDLSASSQIQISIDTSKAEVMQAAVDAGATIINDVYALQNKNALVTALNCDVPVCLMHMQGNPEDMQDKPQYSDVVDEVKAFLLERAQICIEAGICKDKIIIDPGFGFGKSVEHNFKLLNELKVFADTGLPVLVGLSRKSMIDKRLHLAVDQRLSASIALAVMALERGARILRVHDVLETSHALEMFEATHGN